MSESLVGQAPAGEGTGGPATAGSLLRDARVAKGLHIAALATSIKVAPRKLELLEADRYNELPGATFTRALAQTVCRSLKIDAAPVLALLPHTDDHNLSQLSMGLNEPFRDKPGRRVPSDLQFLKNPVILGAVLLVVASLALYLLPAGWVNELTQRAKTAQDVTKDVPVPAIPASAPDAAIGIAEAASEPVQTSSIVVETVDAGAASATSASAPAIASVLPASVPVPASASAASVPAPVAVAASGVLLLRASAESWVEVIDRNGSTLISRVLQAGESVGLDGASPLRIKIGNAAATKVTYKGKVVDLQTARDNVARFELR